MALLFEIFPNTSEPIYLQIETQIRKAIASGRLKKGDQLPSVRALAEQLTVNPNTVSRAYAELTTEGVVESHPGRGVFVAERRAIYSGEERERRLDEALHRLLDDTAFLDLPLSRIIKRLETLSTQYHPKPPKI